MRHRFERALVSDEPFLALNALALELKARGATQITLFRLFAEYQQKTDGGDPRYDAIVDNMDYIWGGPWAKGRALFEHELTDEEVR